MPDQIEAVVSVPLNRLRAFPNHPFKVRDDDAMRETVESVKEYGVLTPVVLRPEEGGEYEIVAGHRRAHAAEPAGPHSGKGGQMFKFLHRPVIPP